MSKVKICARDLLNALDSTVQYSGEIDLFITNVKPVTQAEGASLTFISSDRKDKFELFDKCQASLIIVDKDFLNYTKSHTHPLIFFSENPRLAFVNLVTKFFQEVKKSSIHPSAIIHPEAIIGNNVNIGPGVVLEKVVIGDNSIIHGNSYLFDNVRVGRNVVIWPGCVIGSDGFGYLKNEQNEPINFPHIGGVLVEDGVHIGANTCIDRGALNDTIIKRNAKIDNLVHIAHNCVIGEGAYVIANAMIGGSTVVGNNTWIAPSSSLRDAITIGDNTTIGMGAVIVKSIGDKAVVTGNPGRQLDEFKKINSYLSEIGRKKN